jgi:hypothetical protein
MSQIDFDNSPFDEGRERRREPHPPRNKIPQFIKVTPDTVLVTQQPEHRELAGIIAGGWDRADQTINTRPFVATAISSQYGGIYAVSIHIDGTPPRGMVIVTLSNPAIAVRLDNSKKNMSKSHMRLLHQLAVEIVAAAWPKVETL